MSSDNTTALASIQESRGETIQHNCWCGNFKASTLSVDGVGNSDTVHSTQWAQSVTSSGDASNNVAISTDISWAERMELEEEYTSEELPQNSKVLLTDVTQPTEEFLCEVFAQKDNATRRQLWQQFIVPSMPFTTAPHLDKTIVDECSKNTKTSDNTLSPKSRPCSWMRWDPSLEYLRALIGAKSSLWGRLKVQ